MVDEDKIEFVEKLKNSDEAAFKTLYNFYYPKLYYFIFEFIPEKGTVENIVQDTFLTLWKKRTVLDDNTIFTAYLFTVAKNNCLRRLRDLRYRKNLINSSVDIGDLELSIDSLKSFDTSLLIVSEIENIVKATLDSLPPQCRKVFELSRFQHKKNKEIAEELDISVKTVEGHLTKGLKRFRETLKDYLPLSSFLLLL